MKLSRTELDSGFSEKLFDIDANQFISDELTFFEKSIKGTISVERITNGYHVRGYIEIPFELTCDRCLIQFNELKQAEINLILTDESELFNEDSDDVLLISQTEHEIELGSIFRELILLEKQMKTICKEDCKGLCSNCGNNLNSEMCDCFSKTQDNPWEVLKNLKGK